jgi:hypothetical protein
MEKPRLSNPIKHMKLHVPIPVHERMQRYRAGQILQGKPDKSLEQTALELIDQALKEKSLNPTI